MKIDTKVKKHLVAYDKTTGEEVPVGSEISDRDGKKAILSWLERANEMRYGGNKSGKVGVQWVDDGFRAEYYDSVFNLEVRETDWEDEINKSKGVKMRTNKAKAVIFAKKLIAKMSRMKKNISQDEIVSNFKLVWDNDPFYANLIFDHISEGKSKEETEQDLRGYIEEIFNDMLNLVEQNSFLSEIAYGIYNDEAINRIIEEIMSEYANEIGKSKTKKGAKMKAIKSKMKKAVDAKPIYDMIDILDSIENTELGDAIDQAVEYEFGGGLSDIRDVFWEATNIAEGATDDDIDKSKSKKGANMERLTKTKNIRLKGYNGTWRVIKSRGPFSLLESEQYGNKALNIVLKGKKILKEVDAEEDKQTKEFFGNKGEEEQKCNSKTFKADDVDEGDKADEGEKNDEVQKRRRTAYQKALANAKKNRTAKRRMSKEGEPGLPKQELDDVEHPETDDKIKGEGPVDDSDGKPAMVPEEVEMPNETALPEEMLDHEELEEINSTEDTTGSAIIDLDPAEAIDKMRNKGMSMADLREQLRKQDLGEQSTPVTPSGHPYARIGEGKLSNKLRRPTGEVRKF